VTKTRDGGVVEKKHTASRKVKVNKLNNKQSLVRQIITATCS